MMKCPVCDTVLVDNSASCPICSAEFEVDEGGEVVAQSKVVARSNGGALIGGGWALVAGSVLLYLLAETSGASSRSLDGLATSWRLALLSGAMFQIGLFLAIAGVIVRAIWFLPGDQSKQL